MKHLSGTVLLLTGIGVSLALILTVPTTSVAQATAEEMAQANNPLAGAYALNLQNYYAPALYGVPDGSINTFWVRAAIPAGRTLTRASLPLATRPTGGSSSVSGLGDFNVFTAYMVVSNPSTSIGAGPLLVAPTATDDALGQGKWQAGAAVVAFKATRAVQFGGLLTWQASFAGDANRPSTSVLALQPFSIWQVGGGTYLRSTGIWTFDLESGSYVVPIGFGVGHVVKAGTVVYNMWLEPQFSILHDGTGQPKVQIMAGLNLQYPK